MSIAQLTATVPPPARPTEVGDDAAWQDVQDYLGLTLPDDLRDFADTFGTGKFSAVSVDASVDLWVLNPYSAQYQKRFTELCDVIRWQSEEGEGAIPFKVYPNRPGLFPWGDDVDGNQMFWLTDGEPEKWPIILWGRSAERGEHERFDLPLTTFLAQAFQRKITSSMWPEPYFTNLKKLEFQPEEPPAESQPEPKTIYQLYAEYGNRAGFWVRSVRDRTGCIVFVKTVGGRASGPLEETSDSSGNLPVITDRYINGELQQSNVLLQSPDLHVFVPVKPLSD